jgi:hypothetical protein
MNTPREGWEIPARWVAPREDAPAFVLYSVRPWAGPADPPAAGPVVACEADE